MLLFLRCDTVEYLWIKVENEPCRVVKLETKLSSESGPDLNFAEGSFIQPSATT